MASRKNGTLYVGVTSNIIQRIYRHKNNLIDGFTKKYGINRLVYYELYKEMTLAIEREKRIKKWKRQWKINVIEKYNPNWNDLYLDII